MNARERRAPCVFDDLWWLVYVTWLCREGNLFFNNNLHIYVRLWRVRRLLLQHVHSILCSVGCTMQMCLDSGICSFFHLFFLITFLGLSAPQISSSMLFPWCSRPCHVSFMITLVTTYSFPATLWTDGAKQIFWNPPLTRSSQPVIKSNHSFSLGSSWRVNHSKHSNAFYCLMEKVAANSPKCLMQIFCWSM